MFPSVAEPRYDIGWPWSPQIFLYLYNLLYIFKYIFFKINIFNIFYILKKLYINV